MYKDRNQEKPAQKNQMGPGTANSILPFYLIINIERDQTFKASLLTQSGGNNASTQGCGRV